MDEDDGLYDGLPEMCDIHPSLDREITSSSSTNESNILYLSYNSEDPAENTVDNESDSINRCICYDSLQWTWENSDESTYVEIEKNNLDVRFHSHHSMGTAMVRCSEPMLESQYYWEVKMTSPVYGTDIMLGVGTSAVPVKDLENQFISALGLDDQTWGLSYRGLFRHNGESRSYSQKFQQGDVIGVHLDLWRGTLSFYLDRKNLGIAASGLRGKTLYAMASSTAAFTGMRILRSSSFPSSLQFLCCFKLRELVPADKDVLDVLNIPPGLKRFLKRKLSWLLSERCFDGSDVCNFDHGKTIDNDMPDDSDMGSVLSTLMNDHSSSILYNSVLYRNYCRFLGRESNQRNRGGSGTSLQNLS